MVSFNQDTTIGVNMEKFDISKAVDARKFSLHAKATVQRTGKLGFSMEAAELLGLRGIASESASVSKRIVLQDVGNNDWLAVIVNGNDERGFRIQKGGDYYYLNMRQYFKAAEIDYQNNRVIYDISATNESFEGGTVYLFKFRQHPNRRKEALAEDETAQRQ